MNKSKVNKVKSIKNNVAKVVNLKDISTKDLKEIVYDKAEVIGELTRIIEMARVEISQRRGAVLPQVDAPQPVIK